MIAGSGRARAGPYVTQLLSSKETWKSRLWIKCMSCRREHWKYCLDRSKDKVTEHLSGMKQLVNNRYKDYYWRTDAFPRETIGTILRDLDYANWEFSANLLSTPGLNMNDWRVSAFLIWCFPLPRPTTPRAGLDRVQAISTGIRGIDWYYNQRSEIPICDSTNSCHRCHRGGLDCIHTPKDTTFITSDSCSSPR